MSRRVSRRSHSQEIAAAVTATTKDRIPTPGRNPISTIPDARNTTEVPARRSAETAPRLRLSVSRRRRPSSGVRSTARRASPASPPGSTALMNAACQQRATAGPRPISMPWPRATSLHRWACTATPIAPKNSAPTNAGQVSTPAAAANGSLPHIPSIHTKIPAVTATCAKAMSKERRLIQATALPRDQGPGRGVGLVRTAGTTDPGARRAR